MSKVKCRWKNCPIKIGFEIYFQNEEDETSAKKTLLPLIKKFFNSGNRLNQFCKEHKEGKK